MRPLAFDPHYSPYQSQRNVVYAKNGMVATSQPLAAQVGIDILKKGGNAIDAAIATAACLTVVEPTSNGIGGDAFALVWTKGKLHGLNSSGPAPMSISIEKVKEAGHEKMPQYGWIPVTVPGAPAAWVELSKRFGRLPLLELLKPAIDYATNGFPISPTLGRFWKKAYEEFKSEFTGKEFAAWFETFAPKGRAPEVGELWSSLDHADTLYEIARTEGESFYRGAIAEQISEASDTYGGYLTKDDLAMFKLEWVDPIKVNYRGYDVWEIPPNGQGIIALMTLNILQGFEFPSKDSTDTYHKQIEAMKLAYACGKQYITDPKHMGVTVEELLGTSYGQQRQAQIGSQACTPAPGTPPRGGTVYLATADGEGNMVSFIQSNYKGFGSGIVVPGTGIALQNRGYDFILDPSHYNCLEGGKKTYHTIIPGFLTKDNNPVGPFGVMGGYMQPQGHVQVIMNTIDFHLHPQAALDAPRWQWITEKTVQVEKAFPSHIAEELARKGHNIRVNFDSGSFGRGQIIWRNPETGVLMGGTESRTDGAIAIW
ncbi:gamma-glutamyltransferase [Peribacillus frigoritolerans]|uniref:gamma-glutamyltransferase n=2 Tax=Peribacillus frigoritolerans TaxID=450367 RepID=UPI002E215ED1|nr:gamma-glutamyltransferase [Peribacillus frigoritolerans]MED3790003.1 gamma-glutamyltransferase [Peribacillus frigoritolerans]MED3892190.1 gamma-glutamyltransferase [Peribacillus frigoritolerans]